MEKKEVKEEDKVVKSKGTEEKKEVPSTPAKSEAEETKATPNTTPASTPAKSNKKKNKKKKWVKSDEEMPVEI